MAALPTDLLAVLSAYGLDAARGVRPLADGRAWLFDHAGHGALVATRRDGHGNGAARVPLLEAADALVAELHAAGYPCPRPIPRVDGGYVTHVADRLFQVATFAPGQTDWADRSVGRLTQVGRRLGEFHAFQQDRPLPNLATPDFAVRSRDGLAIRGEELQAAGLAAPATLALLEDATSRAVDLWPLMTELPVGLCHLDFSPGNVLFEAETLSAVIDFELFPVAYTMDIAFAFLYWCIAFDPRTETVALDRASAATLLSAYVSARPLARREHDTFKDVLVWSAARWWSRQASQKPDDPLWRLASRRDTYTICRDLDPDWLASLLTPTT